MLANQNFLLRELQELTWQALKIDDWEKRFKSIWNEVQEDKISIKKVRMCEYCGKKQHLTSWQETIIKTEWVDEK